MLLINCPYCGERDESEFACGGEAHIARPLQTDSLTDQQWGDYLFMRKNTKGVHFERWNHARGCRRWFNAARHTVTHEIIATYKMGEPPPAVSK
jgi:heterotetrameric sarcosine oxidase delta subunit